MSFDGTGGRGPSLQNLFGFLHGAQPSGGDTDDEVIAQALAEAAQRARLPKTGGLFGADYARFMADYARFMADNAPPVAPQTLSLEDLFATQPTADIGSAGFGAPALGPQASGVDRDRPTVNPADNYEVAGPATANPYPRALDPIIEKKVAAYNKMNQADPGDDVYLDPDLIKAMVRVESGHDLKAYNSDPMQVNNPGDWDAPSGQKGYKSDLGLKEGVPPGAEDGIRAGLDWLDSKSYLFDGKGRAGPFLGYDKALQRYNGGGNPHYVNDVRNAYRDIKAGR